MRLHTRNSNTYLMRLHKHGMAASDNSARSALPWMAVSGVRSSWASLEVSRCSDRIAIETRSSSPLSYYLLNVVRHARRRPEPLGKN